MIFGEIICLYIIFDKIIFLYINTVGTKNSDIGEYFFDKQISSFDGYDIERDSIFGKIICGYSWTPGWPLST